MDTQETYVEWLPQLFPPQGKWTEADYFALPETNRIIELSDGVLIMPPAPDDRHAEAVIELAFALKQHVDANKLGMVRVAPRSVRLWEGKIREPDVFFISRERSEQVEARYYGPPDWVAEIISPGSRHTDEVEKLAEYARAGIPEYWLVDAEQATIRVYALRGGEAYTLAGTYAAGQVARSETVAGFAVAVDEVFPGG